MSRRSVLAAGLIAIVAVLLIVGSSLGQASNAIDDRWTGNPMPPCFRDAQACNGHVLGTDEIGRDLVTRLVFGAGVSLGMSLVATLLSLAIGAALGAFGRYGGAFVRFLILAVADGVSSFAKWPFILAAVLVVEMTFQSSHHAPMRFVGLVLAAALFWPQITGVVVRTAPREIAGGLFDRALGEWAAITLVLATVDFFGFGVQPPTPSLGSMLADMQSGLQTAPWLAVAPGLCIFVAVYAIEIVRRSALRAR